MRTVTPAITAAPHCSLSTVLLGLVLLSTAACNGPNNPAKRGDSDLAPYWPVREEPAFQEASYASLQVAMPTIENAEYVNDDQLCLLCHEGYTESHQTNVHREQSCEKCHGPASRHLESRGREEGSILSLKNLAPAQASEVCLQCHEENSCTPGAKWRTSAHAHNGVACTSCHTAHYNVPPGTPATEVAHARRQSNHELVAMLQDDEPIDQASLRVESQNLGALTPQVCYRCHAGMEKQQTIAHPHQMCGATGMDCNTCHDPHGNIRQETRKDLCLECHQGAPAMAYHSSIHDQYGVACTDCHNPHPNQNVQALVNIDHTEIRRPRRLPMSVNEPNVCFKCHADVYGQTSMPSHHPIKEGKMVCSDCHDAHGQSQGNLRDVTVNLVCYRCHAEKQGPFTYEHPPVTENCAICHEPHGTVANNLLRQPATFLCLRCHTGHRTGPGFHDFGLLGDIGNDPNLQRAFFSDCTECHSQIHGSDVPSPHVPHAFAR